ncbi:MAG: Do family serine endopeptidase [Alphaproteobacteria bacterium]|jgi:serine protease Do|nr:Do family serine endopeptidase [Candidatus Jidaibacter sp.]
MLRYVFPIITIIFATILVNCSFAAAAPTTFAPIVENATPAIVNIATTQSIEMKNPFDDLRMEMPEGSPFDQFFREFFDREFGMHEGRKRKATSLGSGFIIDTAGHIVTNFHVIEGADDISVTLSNDPDKSYQAKLIGADKRTDLALLKIDSKTPLPFLKMGNSDAAKVGDWVIAIGNPFGLGGTVTAGIISAKSRLIGGQYDELIQTDASINRGNSGGPMINIDSEVIGINSVIISPSGGNIGIGFAIPSNQALPIINQLKDHGAITRGWLGVVIQPLTEDIAKNIGVDITKGVIVSEVVKGSPAEKSGIKVGDVISTYEGVTVSQPQKLSNLVANTPIGNKAQINLVRDGKPMKVDVAIEKLDPKLDEVVQQSPSKDAPKSDATPQLGMHYSEITEQLRAKFKLDKSVSGVVITKVLRGSVSGEVGLKPGDVIMKANKVKIIAPNDLTKEIQAAKNNKAKNIVLLVNRNNSNRFIVVELE